MLFRVFSSGITNPTCTSKLSAWNVPAATKTILSLKPICELAVTKASYKRGRDKSDNQNNRIKYKNFSTYETKQMESPEVIRQKSMS